jgi:hypothetical protein
MGCVVSIVVVCSGVAIYIVCVGVAIVPGGKLYVYCCYCMVVVVCLPALCIAVVMAYVPRIGPTWVADVGTGATRFLVSPQKTHVAYLKLPGQVMRGRSRPLPGCYFSTK